VCVCVCVSQTQREGEIERRFCFCTLAFGTDVFHTLKPYLFRKALGGGTELAPRTGPPIPP
jgi:hypothetical protein